MRDGYYHTGDVATRDADGYLTFVGRADDVFKASDYRISPFELESALIEHEAVAEAAVVPSPDPLAHCGAEGVRRARIGYRADARNCAAGDLRVLPHASSRPTSGSAGSSSRDLPKTISGKIRRVELRQREAAAARRAANARRSSSSRRT